MRELLGHLDEFLGIEGSRANLEAAYALEKNKNIASAVLDYLENLYYYAIGIPQQQ